MDANLTGAFLVLTDHVICLKSKWSLIKKQSKFVVLKNGCLKLFFFFPPEVFLLLLLLILERKWSSGWKLKDE